MRNFSNLFITSSVCFALSLQTLTVNAQNKDVKMTNPLLQKSTLQYQAPNFNLIKDEYFKPAFEYALKINSQEVETIANNSANPTFQNTVLALETSGVDLNRAMS